MQKSIVITTQVKRGEIINNFADIRAQVAAKVAPYMGLIFGDDDIRDAKGTLAELRKMRSAIEDKRKAIKKQWNEPYDEFEKEVRQITEIIDGPIGEIDAQIKDYEERRRLAKREECEAIVSAVVESIEDEGERDFVKACSIVFDERWLNATTATTQVEKDVQAQVDKILADSRTITEVCEDDDMLTELLVEYQGSKDLAGVLMKRKRLVEQRDAAERLRASRQAEAEIKKAMAAPVELKYQEKELPATGSFEHLVSGADAPKKIKMAFVLEGTLEQLKTALGYVRTTDGVTVTRLYKHGSGSGEYWDDGSAEAKEA
jgi:hypothetical protein